MLAVVMHLCSRRQEPPPNSVSVSSRQMAREARYQGCCSKFFSADGAKKSARMKFLVQIQEPDVSDVRLLTFRELRAAILLIKLSRARFGST